MRPIQKKLRSSRGASITYALLIFLVCAVVSSIVIVSASTAGGRMSGLKETDQRYYAAVGAARTLRDIFEGSDEVTVTYDPEDTATATADSTNAIVKAASEAVVTGTLNTTEPISITPPTGSTVTCSVQPKLENGLLKFEISAVGGSNINTGTYKLTIAFTPNVKMPDLGNGKTGKATVSWSLNSLRKGRATPTTTNPGGGT